MKAPVLILKKEHHKEFLFNFGNYLGGNYSNSVGSVVFFLIHYDLCDIFNNHLAL